MTSPSEPSTAKSSCTQPVAPSWLKQWFKSGFAAGSCMIRSYQPENARSRPISEAKQAWAGVVVWWGTTCEGPVSNLFVVWTRPSATLCCAPALPLAGSFAAAAACTRLFQPIYTYLHLSTGLGGSEFGLRVGLFSDYMVHGICIYSNRTVTAPNILILQRFKAN